MNAVELLRLTGIRWRSAERLFGDFRSFRNFAGELFYGEYHAKYVNTVIL